MTSTRTNRTAIAAILLGLLATIAGTRAQDLCVCSPRKYSVSFDLAQDCDSTNDIAGLPGILSAFTYCFDNVKEVTRAEIIEYYYSTVSKKWKTVFSFPEVTSGEVDYTSVSNKLQPGVSLGDQVDDAPLGITLNLYGNDEDGNPVLLLAGRSGIVYTNECDGTGPINFQNSGLGYVRLVSITMSIIMYQLHYPYVLTCSPHYV
jgi:hypothetical protein